MSRILLVDDEPHVVRVIKLALDRKGYVVEVARNGVEALEKLRERAFDVVITDFQMPRMDGRALCEAIASEPATCRPLTLIVSGKPDLELSEWATGAVHAEFLEKPVSLKRLVARLADYFQTQSDERKVEA